MTFDSTTLSAIGIFLAITVLSVLVFRAVGVKSFAWSLAVAYFVFSAGFHVLFWKTYQMGQGGLAVLIPAGLALPSSLLLLVFRGGGFIAGLFLLTALGTAQYFGIGWLIDRTIKRSRMREQNLGGTLKNRTEDGTVSKPHQD